MRFTDRCRHPVLNRIVSRCAGGQSETSRDHLQRAGQCNEHAEAHCNKARHSAPGKKRIEGRRKPVSFTGEQRIGKIDLAITRFQIRFGEA